MDRALDAVFARPTHHLARGRPVLDAAEADLAEQLDAVGGHLLEIVFDHLAFDHGRAGMPTFTPPGRKVQNARCANNRHRLEANDIARPARHVHLAGGDHGGDAAMQVAVDPAHLVLPRCPVASDGMNMAVDQAGARPWCRAHRRWWWRPRC